MYGEISKIHLTLRIIKRPPRATSRRTFVTGVGAYGEVPGGCVGENAPIDRAGVATIPTHQHSLVPLLREHRRESGASSNYSRHPAVWNAHIVTMFERIGNVGNFRKANIGQTQVAETRAPTAGCRKDCYTLGKRRRWEKRRTGEENKAAAQQLRQDPDHGEPRLFPGMSERGQEYTGQLDA